MSSVTIVSTPDDGSCGIGTYTGELLREFPENVEATHVTVPFRSFNPLQYVAAATQAGMTVNRVVHIQHEYGIFATKSIWSWVFFPVLFVLSRLRNRRVVLTFHGAWNEGTIAPPLARLKRMYVVLNNRLLARTAHHAIFLSDEAATDFQETTSLDSYEVVPHGVQVETIDQSQAKSKEKFGYSSDTPLIVEPGYIRRQKGCDIFVGVAENLPEFEFLLAGGCQDTESYCRTVRESAPDNVQITGVLDNDEFHAAFVAADIVFLPYRKVTQSGIFNWAVAYNRPVLASDEQYFQTLNSEWGCAETVDIDDQREAIRQLRELHNSTERKRELRRRMANYREETSLAAIAERHTELYTMLKEQ